MKKLMIVLMVGCLFLVGGCFEATGQALGQAFQHGGDAIGGLIKGVGVDIERASMNNAGYVVSQN